MIIKSLIFGLLCGLFLFAAAMITFLYIVTPKGVSFGQMMFSIGTVRAIVASFVGCAIGLIMGSSLLFWLAQALNARLKMLTGAGN